jgi:hypothetical protein
MPITISGSTGIAGVDGSASTPAVQGTDTNTGIFFPAADTIAFGEGGSEAMRIDSSGNVGIGTSSPGSKLQVTNSGASDTYISTTNSAATSGFDFGVSSGGDGYLYNRNNAPIIFGTNSAERARITTNGQFTISSQPSFRVSRSNASGVTGVVLFDNIYHNIGNHYNSSTGRFTAPVTGNYLFTATGGQSSAYGFDIRLNGLTACRVELVGVTFGYTWKSGVVVLRMNANDYVDVYVFTGATQFEPSFGSFTGQLLS